MSRKLLVLLALLVISGILVYWTVASEFNWKLFFSTLRSVKVPWLLASIIFTMLTYAFRATRWHTLLAPIKSIPFTRLFWATMVGFSVIYVLGRAGELARPLWLTRREQVPFSASVATIIVERFLDSLMLIVMFAWALMVIDVPAQSAETLAQLKRGAWIIAAVAVAAIILLFVLRSNVEWVVRPVRYIRFTWLARAIENFARGLAFLASARSLALVVLHSAALWVAIGLQFWFMLVGMNFDFSAAEATLVMVAAAIGSIVQVPGIGGGFQLAYVSCLTTFFLVPKEQAVATVLIATVFSYVPTITVGGSYMLLQGISMRDLKTSVRNPESETV